MVENSVQQLKTSSAAPNADPMGEQVLTPTQLKAKAAELIASGDMPSIDQFLDAVLKVRKRYASKIKEARHKK